MKEFGSDFHRCDTDFRILCQDVSRVSLMNMYGCTLRMYACGRHAIDALVEAEGWKRIWVPAYFCYEVIAHIKATGIEVSLYDDNPLREDDDVLVRSLNYREGDVLLRMNYFGIRELRTNKGIPVPVIEDHTHDLTSQWALKSDADYCIASIRKSLPVAAGGILWSPKGLPLPNNIESTEECETMAGIRYEGMRMKREYLLQMNVDKDAFRKKYLTSEKLIEELKLSGMDKESNTIACNLNIGLWSEIRADNLRIAYEQLRHKFTILKPSVSDYWQNPFSLILLCKNAEERTALRAHIIKNMIYPAILWQMPVDTEFKRALDFSQRMLSVHVDARYNRNDILELCNRISQFNA